MRSSKITRSPYNPNNIRVGDTVKVVDLSSFYFDRVGKVISSGYVLCVVRIDGFSVDYFYSSLEIQTISDRLLQHARSKKCQAL